MEVGGSGFGGGLNELIEFKSRVLSKIYCVLLPRYLTIYLGIPKGLYEGLDGGLGYECVLNAEYSAREGRRQEKD